MEKISFNSTNADLSRVCIVGNYWKGRDDKAVILLHMMPAVKESWNDFAEKLNAMKYHVLAIDLRGHGESTEITEQDGEKRILNYQTFSDLDHQQTTSDIEGARDFLLKKGMSPESIFIGGASIGANLALQFMILHTEIKKGILLSPGIDYHGIKGDELMGKTSTSQKLFLTAAENDIYSHKSVRALQNIGQAEKTVKLFKGVGARTHGTDLFKEYPEFMDELTTWLNS